MRKAAKKTPAKKRAVIDVIPDDTTAAVLAASIVEISRGVEALRRTRLTDRAIILLINDACDVPMATIRKVLDGMAELERRYVK